MWQRWLRVRDRVQPHARRGFFAAMISLVYVGGLVALVGVPLQLFLAITHGCGVAAAGVLQLSPCGRPLLIATAALTLGLSVAIGGMARVLLDREHLGPIWLAVLTLVSLYAVSASLDDMRSALSALHQLSRSDNITAGTFIGFWILMVGYAAKAAWDESRDRVTGQLRALIRRWDEGASARDARRCPHCGQVMPHEIVTPVMDEIA
ncbi:hypothetical protein [Sphingomonas sp. PAMC 26617]|uniref:hypothetical protein n=1 Tax=Sphingomonas sp. PAMC 26617 TaxID=1112216 RepID=UPI00028A29EB|nr:hypothetical protein [Sphingomonas sp. PAMC 26617]